MSGRKESYHDINRQGLLCQRRFDEMKEVETKVTPSRRTHRLRWGIGVLLGVGVLINYFDRINLSVAAPQLKHDFGLTDGELGWILMASSGPTRCCKFQPA